MPTARRCEGVTATGVESTETKVASADITYDHVTLPGKHWRVQMVRFQDVTDAHNTLVQEDTYLLYGRDLPVETNLLIAKDLVGGGQVLWLKKSPLGKYQLAYPGHDFILRYDSWGVTGGGVLADTVMDQWQALYSTALGVADSSEQNALTVLRYYLQRQRTYENLRIENA